MGSLWLVILMTAAGGARDRAPAWLGEQMPLPLQVHTPEDLAFKSVAERQYLIFNLMAAGKVAWDRGDFATAATRWEALLRLENLAPEIDEVVRPMAIDARKRAGGDAVAALPPPRVKAPPPPPPPSTVAVTGRISAGGGGGPGGAVVWLMRADGRTPRPRSVTRVMNQRDKRFTPNVVAVPVGSQVSFKNQDEIFHNVFSLTRGSDFDLGLYGKDLAKAQRFDRPGPVQVLCNIHASMQGWVYVVESPWYDQAAADGTFKIGKVPPGEYVAHAWHPSASEPVQRRVSVGPDGAQLELSLTGDVRPSSSVPDKYGKPRQVQLGY